LPIFASPLFLQFCQSLKAYMETAVSPFDASIEAILTGIQAKIDDVHKDIGGQIHVISEKLDSAKHRLQQTVTTTQLQGLVHRIGQFEVRHPSSASITNPIPAQESSGQQKSSDYVLFRGHKSIQSGTSGMESESSRLNATRPASQVESNISRQARKGSGGRVGALQIRSCFPESSI
jgi:hypothetical protein